MTSNSSKIRLATSTILQLKTIGENIDVVKWEFPFFCGVDVDYWSEEKQKFMDIREKSQTALPQKKKKKKHRRVKMHNFFFLPLGYYFHAVSVE